MQARGFASAAFAAFALTWPGAVLVFGTPPGPTSAAVAGDVAFAGVTRPTGKVWVKKVVVSDAGYTAPPNATFPITLSCQLGSNMIMSPTVTLGANGISLIPGVPVGSTCTASEQLPGSVSYAESKRCPSVGWLPPTIAPNPLSATTAGIMSITVTNHYGCLSPRGTVTVTKSIYNQVPSFQIPPTAFTITLQCPSWPLLTATTVSGVAQFNSVPAGVSCTVDEQLPAPYPTNKCWTSFAFWLTPYIYPNPIVVPANGNVTVAVTNTLDC